MMLQSKYLHYKWIGLVGGQQHYRIVKSFCVITILIPYKVVTDGGSLVLLYNDAPVCLRDIARDIEG